MNIGSLYAMKPFEYSRISPCLLAGRHPLTGEDVAQLIAEGVSHILDLRESSEWLPPRLGQEALTAIEQQGLVRGHVAITDGAAPTRDNFARCVAFLDDALSNPQAQIYVHCRAGMERTAAILIAWYARRERLSYDEALQQLQAKRSVLHPLPWQEEATRLWLNSEDAT